MDVQSSEVSDVPQARHFVIRVNGEQVGLAAYVLDGSTVTFTHTEVTPELEGQGIGGDLVRGALDEVRRRGLTVVPQCPFVADWIEEHHEYADLLTSR